MTPTNTGMSESTFAPFREPVFRSLWIGSFISNIGTWMQNIAVGWAAAAITSSGLLISMLSVALSLPSLFISYPAGVISDHTNRRVWLILLQAFLFITMLVLSVLTHLHLLNIYVLIIFNFLTGIGAAFSAPVWQAIVPEIVSWRHLKSAIALNGLNFNLSRAIGPALGGVLLVYGGIQSIFLFNTVSFLALIIGLYNWRNQGTVIKGASFKQASLEGIRAAGASSSFKKLLIRSLSFTIFISIVFAVLPHLSKYQWHQTSKAYTAMWGILGIGALFGSVIFNKLANRFAYHQIVWGASEVVGAGLLLLGEFTQTYLIGSVMFIIGTGWICITSSLNVLAQLYSPRQLKGRLLSLNITVFQGSIAVSSMVWGYISDKIGDELVFTIAGAGMMMVSAALLFFPLQQSNDGLLANVPCTEPLVLPESRLTETTPDI